MIVKVDKIMPAWLVTLGASSQLLEAARASILPLFASAAIGQGVEFFTAGSGGGWVWGVVGGVLVQLLILVSKALFSERREVLKQWRALLEAEKQAKLEETAAKHALVNDLSAARIEIDLLRAGVPPDQIEAALLKRRLPYNARTETLSIKKLREEGGENEK